MDDPRRRKMTLQEKREKLVDAIADDHRILDKFHNMFSEEDIKRLGGEMTASLMSANNQAYSDESLDDGVSFVEVDTSATKSNQK
jgi:hypothetical protein